MDLFKERKKLLISLALLAAAAFMYFRLYSSPEAVRARAEKALVISSGTISGSLDDILKQRGFADADRFRISAAFSKVINLRRLRPEDEYSIAFSTASELKYMFIARDEQRQFN